MTPPSSSDECTHAGGGWRHWRDRLLLQEDLNFLLTNRVPRIALSRAMGWYAGLRSPALTRMSIAVWRLFSDLDLSESPVERYTRLRDCFTRPLLPGRRPLDPVPGRLLSPSDGLLGACGVIERGQMLQAKGMPYRLADLLGDEAAAAQSEGCAYATLRLTSAMYHRFHAPAAGRIVRVVHLDGDTWNVNPIALARVERLFCRNERACVELERPEAGTMRLVAVAAILVSGLHVHGLGPLRRHPPPPGGATRRVHTLDRAVQAGDEVGHFEHGSTIIAIAPPGYRLLPQVRLGDRLRMGQGLFEPGSPASP